MNKFNLKIEGINGELKKGILSVKNQKGEIFTLLIEEKAVIFDFFDKEILKNIFGASFKSFNLESLKIPRFSQKSLIFRYRGKNLLVLRDKGVSVSFKTLISLLFENKKEV